MKTNKKSPDANRDFYQSNKKTQLNYSTLKAMTFRQTLEFMLAGTQVANEARRQALLKILAAR